MTRRLPTLAALTLLLLPGLSLGTAAPACAAGADDLPAVSDAALHASVHDLDLGLRELMLPVQDVDSTVSSRGETVVSLKSDVLFGFGKADLPPSAPARLAQLISKAPKNTKVKVYGFTDSVGSPASNLTLSRKRAAAVAAAVRQARPDLRLDVRGFGEAQPVEPNTKGGKDDPQARSLNRRVEIRFAS